jgi:polysaccharide export outer membrane protein
MRKWAHQTAKRAALLLLVLAASFVVAGAQERAEHLLEPEDVVEIQVLDQLGEGPTTILKQVPVGEDGRISVPFVGSWEAEGKTVKQLIDELTPEFERVLKIKSPLVSVSLVSYRKILASVTGAVSKPGRYEIRRGETLLSLLSQGGGILLDNKADPQRVTLRRKDSREVIPINLQALFDGDTSQNYTVEDGDELYVPEADRLDKVLVWGKIKTPGAYAWTPGMRVMDALAAAGGEIPTQSKFSKTLVIRQVPNQPGQYLRIECNIVDFVRKGDATQNIELQKRDVVIVPDTGNPNFDQINQILGVFFILDRFGINILRF